MPDEVLEVRELEKSFGDVDALNRVTLSIEKGQFVCLLGPSGCGKTTILRILAGFEKPDGGTVSLNGRVVSSARHSEPPEDRDMAMMFQSYAVWPHMTVAENVGYGLRARHIRSAERHRRVNEALELIQMGSYGSRFPGELSGGQQQRVSFARAFVTDPSVLLMDEPLSNLDARLREDMLTVLRDMHARLQFTSVYVTHDRMEAMSIADRIVMIRSGRVEQEGTPRELYFKPVSRYAAELLGDVNVMEGRVCADRMAVQVGSERLVADNLDVIADCDEVAVLVRPEWLALSPAGKADAGGWLGRVRDSVFLGSSLRCVVHVPALDKRLTVMVPEGDGQVVVGANVRVSASHFVAVRDDDACPQKLLPGRQAALGELKGPTLGLNSLSRSTEPPATPERSDEKARLAYWRDQG